LFWNVNRKPLAEVVADLADTRDIDVIVLVESTDSAAQMLEALNTPLKRGGFHLTGGDSPAIVIFTRFLGSFIAPVRESERVTIRKLALPGVSADILLAAAHLPSKLHWTTESQAFECTELSRLIAEEEDRAGHQRTILVGDFNMNPFETGLVGAGGLNAVMSRQIAARKSRTVQGREYRFFYNPMWNHFGDGASHTAGTYFYDSTEHVNYFWNVFDQVLLRPGLVEYFDTSRLQVVKDGVGLSLVRADGRPDRTFSDHLPLVFELDFPEDVTLKDEYGH
jgi:endonuclease/exonuclease/phosphatase family metal-dependent hydrolase